MNSTLGPFVSLLPPFHSVPFLLLTRPMTAPMGPESWERLGTLVRSPSGGTFLRLHKWVVGGKGFPTPIGVLKLRGHEGPLRSDGLVRGNHDLFRDSVSSLLYAHGLYLPTLH